MSSRDGASGPGLDYAPFQWESVARSKERTPRNASGIA
jgi:hypothetical protein